jgi:hypothetical protein
MTMRGAGSAINRKGNLPKQTKRFACGRGIFLDMRSFAAITAITPAAGSIFITPPGGTEITTAGTTPADVRPTIIMTGFPEPAAITARRVLLMQAGEAAEEEGIHRQRAVLAFHAAILHPVPQHIIIL